MRMGYITMRTSYRREFNAKVLFSFELMTAIFGAVTFILFDKRAFEALTKPPLTPPLMPFALTGAMLCATLGAAAYMVWNTYDIDGAAILRMYFIMLIINTSCPLIFFWLRLRMLSFFCEIALTAVTTIVMTGFKYIRKASFYLMIPYLIWTIYIAYLTLGLYLLN